MTQTEELVVPLGGASRLNHEKPTKGAKSTLSPRTFNILFTLTLALSIGAGVWAYSETSQVIVGITIAGSGVAVALGVIGTYRLCRRAWMSELAARAAESENLELRLRTQLSEQTRREEELWSERDQLREQAASLARASAGLTEELDRRKETERKASLQRQDLVRSKDVLELHVQASAQELQKFQRRHELILDSAGEGICGLNVEGKVMFANPAAARIIGGKVEKLIGRPITDLFPGLERCNPAEVSAANGGRPSEFTINRPDGSNFVLEYYRSPIREAERFIGEVLLFKDITERKNTETALAQKATELTRSNAELEQFAFVASHDLQEPLRKIQAFGDRLKAKCESANLGEGQEYLERMQNAAARMRTLIDDLLTFSRVISCTEPFVQVDLNLVAREVLGDLEVRIEKSGATVNVDELPTIEADPMQMRQLLQNLIGNALKFHEPGAKPVVHISGKIATKATDISETSLLRRRAVSGDKATVEQFCELTVEDNGIGFDEKYLDRIFAVFQRLHGRQEYEGTGIGLAVCRRIVDRHRGIITAKSKPREGATFTVTLPLQPPGNAPKTA